jgi:DNA-binding Xre family transcriptional regulator
VLLYINKADLVNARCYFVEINPKPRLNKGGGLVSSCLMKVEKRIQKEVPGLGEKIRRARKVDKRPLIELAALAGMSTPNWYAIENEEMKTLPLATLRKVEAVLGVTFGVEFDEDEDEEEQE